MSLAPCLTNIDTSSAPLFALAGQGSTGGGGTNIVASTLSVSTITGDPEFLGSAVYMGSDVAANDGITFVTNPPGSFGAPLVSTSGMRFDMGGQVGYVLLNPTAGLGPGLGMDIFANGITLGSTQGVEIAGAAGNGAGSLTVSSITVSSINGAAPGGGGGVTNIAANLSANTYFAPSDGVIPLGNISTTAGHLHKCSFLVGTVSSFATPNADDRVSFIDPNANVVYTESLAWWQSTMVHNPRGQAIEFTFKAGGANGELAVVANGAAPSTFVSLENTGTVYVTDLGPV
jgi:hypothetical protein